VSSPTNVLPLPTSLPPLDLHTYINNYLLIRSFQRNWTQPSVHHFHLSRPAFDDIAAGEHYFEYYISGRTQPIASVLFLATPAIEAYDPLTYSHSASRFSGISLYVIYHSIPNFLPSYIEEKIRQIGLIFRADTQPFIQFLDDFIDDFHRPVTPPNIPSPLADPLEEEK
jgi:hypothetical protein